MRTAENTVSETVPAAPARRIRQGFRFGGLVGGAPHLRRSRRAPAAAPTCPAAVSPPAHGAADPQPHGEQPQAPQPRHGRGNPRCP